MLIDLASEGDVLFLELYTPQGQTILSTENDTWSMGMEQWKKLMTDSVWHETVRWHGKDVFIYAIRLDPRPTPGRGGPECRNGPGPCPGPPLFLILGIDMSMHLELYNESKKAASWQVFFILGVALIILSLGMALLRRKDESIRLGALEKFQSSLFDNLPDGLVVTSSDGLITAANPATHHILGLEDDPLVGRHWNTICNATKLNPASSQGTDHKTKLGWHLCSLGEKSLEILSIAMISSQTETQQQIILVRDRTLMTALEQNLQEARRMASIGQLAAGLAHEIRNPLSALRGFAQFFASKLKGVEPEQTYAQTMVREADRLNQVINDLLFLASPKKIHIQTIDLPSLIQDIERLLSLDLDHKGVALESNLACPQLEGDIELVRQALLNLVLNSLDAVPDKHGIIRITSNPAEQGVWLSVQDNGPGIPSELWNTVVEPFFTTKPHGTGLGLAMVQKIVLDHKGRFRVSEAASLGRTQVDMLFPGRPESFDKIST